MPVRVWTDSSAAIGICTRQGLGRLRHIDTQALWIQQKVCERNIEHIKAKGALNPADPFTHYLIAKDRVERLVKRFSCEYRPGRADSAPLLRRADGVQEVTVVEPQGGVGRDHAECREHEPRP